MEHHIHGVYVPEAQPEDTRVLPFTAALVPAADSMGKPRPGNFTPDDEMQESLRLAHDACLRHFASPLNLLREFLFPFFGRPLTRPWRLVAVVGLLGCVVFAGGGQIWPRLALSPPAWLLPSREGYWLSWLVLLAAAVLSLPWRILPGPRAWLSGWKSRMSFALLLKSSDFVLFVGSKAIDYGFFFGPSAGLTLFGAMAEAVRGSNRQPFTVPWQGRLLTDGHWLASVALNENNRFGSVGHLAEKLLAMKAFATTHSARGRVRAVFSHEDERAVLVEWEELDKHTKERLTLQPGPVAGCKTARSGIVDLEFVFCERLADFLAFLYPWHWGWATLRFGAVAATALSSFLVSPPTRPEVVISCVPQCLVADDAYSLPVEPETYALVNLHVTSRGHGGLITLTVAATHDEAVFWDGRRVKQFSVSPAGRDVAFFLAMPRYLQSPSPVAVDIALVDWAGKRFQAKLWLKPASAGARLP